MEHEAEASGYAVNSPRTVPSKEAEVEMSMQSDTRFEGISEEMDIENVERKLAEFGVSKEFTEIAQMLESNLRSVRWRIHYAKNIEFYRKQNREYYYKKKMGGRSANVD